jgi:adenylate cyclase
MHSVPATIEMCHGARAVQVSSTQLELSQNEVCEALDQVLASRTFRASNRMKALLKYIVESRLKAKDQPMTEYHIALDVFGRTTSFDPRIDSIVRVEVRRLRSKLRTYFEDEGQGDSIIIELPRGSYVPIIRRSAIAGFSSSRASSPQPEVSIAVLPLLSFDHHKESRLLCDGLTEELIDVLTDTHWVRVCPRTAVVRFKDYSDDIRQIGKRLGVAMLLEGSVRKVGGQLRVSIRLIPAVHGFSQRLGVYNVKMKNALSAQQMISRLIVTDLALRLRRPDLEAAALA